MRLTITILLTTLSFALPSLAQVKVNYDLFNRSFDLPQIIPQTPQQMQLMPAMPIYQSQNILPLLPSFSPVTINNAQQQYQQQLRQYENDAYLVQQRDNAKADAIRDAQETFYPKETEMPAATNSYKLAFLQLSRLNPDNFSLTKAVYLVENAYLDNKMPYSQFNAMLQQRVNIVRQLLKREGLSDKNNLALNYGIQKLYQQEIPFKDTSGAAYIERPFKYDFDDFRGDKDYRKMFVSKMLANNTGQCHSGPLTYLCIAEQLGAKAYLALAPQHSYIRFSDNRGKLQNFETTNGHLVSENWLIHSGYITSAALKNDTYLDTISSRQLYAQMLGDLLLGYMAKFHTYDGFAEQIRQAILQVNPNNLTALIVGANQSVLQAKREWQKAGNPKQEDLPKYPEAYKEYHTMQAALEKVDGKGYQDMSKEAYEKWLKSIEYEKQREENIQLKAAMEKEIQQTKKLREAMQKQLQH